MRATAGLLATVVLFLGALAGCGGDEPADDPATGGTTDANTIEVTFDGDSVSPSGERVEVTRGEPVTFVVTADEPGELHAHTQSEEVLPYEAGTSELELTIDEPGVVDVESHDLDVVIVQLEVS